MPKRRKPMAQKGRSKPPRPRMVTEEETIDRIQALPPFQAAIVMPIYLVASFWPWWLTLLVPAFIAMRVRPDVWWLSGVVWAFLVLTAGGWLVKQGLERALRASVS